MVGGAGVGQPVLGCCELERPRDLAPAEGSVFRADHTQGVQGGQEFPPQLHFLGLPRGGAAFLPAHRADPRPPSAWNPRKLEQVGNSAIIWALLPHFPNEAVEVGGTSSNSMDPWSLLIEPWSPSLPGQGLEHVEGSQDRDCCPSGQLPGGPFLQSRHSAIHPSPPPAGSGEGGGRRAAEQASSKRLMLCKLPCPPSARRPRRLPPDTWAGQGQQVSQPRGPTVSFR